MIKKILVPLDGSELAERAVPFAVEIARALNATIILLGVVPPPLGRGGGAFKAAYGFVADALFPDEPNDLDKARHPVSKESMMASQEAEVKRLLMPVVERIRKQHVRAEVAVAYSRPAGGIILYAQYEEIDLIVMSTHGDGGFKRDYAYAYGGTADRVARRATVPVLLIRPDEISDMLSKPRIEREQG